MLKFKEGNLVFIFPDGWIVEKYDNWSFYKNQFQKIKQSGIKAIDFIAIAPTKTLWLIEVKDYRINRRTKLSDLSVEIAHKVFDTLAGLLPASVNSSNPSEKIAAPKALESIKIRIVLHLEQSQKYSKVFPRKIDSANIKQKMKLLLKPIDPHPLVSEKSNMLNLEWEVN